MWQNWVIGALGIWLIIASFTIKGNLVNELVVGIGVAALGFWTAVKGSSSRPHETRISYVVDGEGKSMP